VSVHRTISTAVLRRFVAAHARTAIAESTVSEDLSSAAATSPDDVTATKSRGCVATCDFSGRETHPQSCRPYRHRNDDNDYERRASGHAGVMEPRADAGSGILRQVAPGLGKKREWNHGHGISQNKSCGIKEGGS